MSNWLRREGKGWFLSVHAQPGAKKTGVAGLHGDSLKIRVAAPPVEGKANAALIAFVARALGVPRSAVALVRGEASREKLLRVTDPRAEPARLLDSDR